MMKCRAPVIGVAIALAAPAAGAAEDLAFRTPSGNITCLHQSGDFSIIRCDLAEFTPSFAETPDWCDWDYGHAFSLTDLDRGLVLCVTDTVIGLEAEVLEHGESFEVEGITCTADAAGMICTNPEGHGFSLTANEQTVF